MSDAKDRTVTYHLEAGGMIEMPLHAAEEMDRPGRMDEVVAYWEQNDRVRFDCSESEMRAELRSIGYEQDEVRSMSKQRLRRHLLWCAAGFVHAFDDGCDADGMEDTADAPPVEAGSSCTDREEVNGWSNWSTWNVSLWMLNEEPLYRVVQDGVRHGKSIKQIVEECFPSGETPDGASIAEVDLDDLQCIVDDEKQG